MVDYIGAKIKGKVLKGHHLIVIRWPPSSWYNSGAWTGQYDNDSSPV